MTKQKKLRVRKLGQPMHIIDNQAIIKNPNFIPKRGAKVIVKGEKGQLFVGVAEFPFGPVNNPYFAVNLDETLDGDIKKKLLSKELYAERYVHFNKKKRSHSTR